MNQEAQGIGCALAGAVLWGCSGSFSQFLFSAYGFSGLGLTAVRTTTSGLLFLAVIIALRRHVLSEIWHDAPARRQVALFGGAGLFLNQLTYLMTIAYTNAGTATVMQSFSIPLIMVVVCLMRHRRPAPREAIALACAVASIFLISTGGNPAVLALPLTGFAWGMANAGATAFYNMYPRALFARYGSFTVTGLGMCVGGAASLLAWSAMGLTFSATNGAVGAPIALPWLDGPGIAALAGVIVLGTCFAFWLYLRGIALAGSMKASMLGAAEPVAATVLSAIWLGTTFSATDWIGLALMVGTILISSMPRKA